jgi:transketolase
VLFSKHLKFDASEPDWPDRDRFVLSAGHGSMLLYSVLHLLGYEDFSLDELKRFRQLGSRTAGHPEYGHGKGIETTTGPLGQGLANAVGMAIAERLLNAQFGDDLVDHRTYVLASDGDLMEGISQEAIALAGHLKLNRLIVLFRRQRHHHRRLHQLSDSTDQVKRFEASGWRAVRIDGHDADAIDAALTEARTSDRPTLIAAKTTIGWGAPKKAGTAASHGSPLGADEIAATRLVYKWEHEPFVLPEELVAHWRSLGSAPSMPATAGRRGSPPPRPSCGASSSAVCRCIGPELEEAIPQLSAAMRRSRSSGDPKSVGDGRWRRINAALPETVGGSADLTPSNNTKDEGAGDIAPGNFSGRFIHYGIREHGMAAAMNGMALHGGIIPIPAPS